MHASPRYTKPEIERRWFVPVPLVLDEKPTRARGIEDRYIISTRLRLRTVTEANQPPIYKLGKKYESETCGAHQVVTTYLDEEEYRIFACLPARVAKKRRYSVYGGCLDVYEYPGNGLQVFEIEFTNTEQACAYAPPSFVGIEITNESKYSGHALARSET